MSVVTGVGQMSEPFERQTDGVLVELVLEGQHRLKGEIQTAGIPRRLVDVLNGVEGAFAVVQDGCVQDLSGEEAEPRTIGAAQVPVDAILFAVPRGGSPRQGDTFETVAKVP